MSFNQKVWRKTATPRQSAHARYFYARKTVSAKIAESSAGCDSIHGAVLLSTTPGCREDPVRYATCLFSVALCVYATCWYEPSKHSITSTPAGYNLKSCKRSRNRLRTLWLHVQGGIGAASPRWLRHRVFTVRAMACLNAPHLNRGVPHVAIRAVSAHVHAREQLLPDVLLPRVDRQHLRDCGRLCTVPHI